MNGDFDDDALADMPIQWIWATALGLIVAMIIIAVMP